MAKLLTTAEEIRNAINEAEANGKPLAEGSAQLAPGTYKATILNGCKLIQWDAKPSAVEGGRDRSAGSMLMQLAQIDGAETMFPITQTQIGQYKAKDTIYITAYLRPADVEALEADKDARVYTRIRVATANEVSAHEAKANGSTDTETVEVADVSKPAKNAKVKA